MSTRLLYILLSLSLLTQCVNDHLDGLEVKTQLSIILRCKLNLADDCAIDSIQPDAVSGLQLWLKADSFTSRSDGSTISGWLDSSEL